MLTRRDFISRSAAVSAAARQLWAAARLDAAGAPQRPSTSPAAAVREGDGVALAEWSYRWIGLEHAEVHRGTLVSGTQMYVEYQVPVARRHAEPVVLVHRQGGQGVDWMATPDGRAGWLELLLRDGYAVYLVDLPGAGRVPYAPDLYGRWTPAPTFEGAEREFTAVATKGAMPHEGARLHAQWPGSGEIGDAALDQLVAGRGQATPLAARTFEVWGSRAALLLDAVGPSFVITHGAGALFGLGAIARRRSLVRGLIAIEPGPLDAGPGTLPLGADLAGAPIVVVTSEASAQGLTDAAAVERLRLRGARVEHLRLAERGVHGNGHFMMLERNNGEVLRVLNAWMVAQQAAPGPTPAPAPGQTTAPATTPAARTAARTENTAVELAGQGAFWVGGARVRTEYGTVMQGQTFVQALMPRVRRQPNAMVLVHGGGGQGTHWMGGGDGQAGFAHYYLQAGYAVYILDCPAYGQSPEHPDGNGVTGEPRTIEAIMPTFARARNNPTPQWSGSAAVGDPGLDGFIAGEVGFVERDLATVHTWWARGAEELLDRIGPVIVQMHTNGGAFAWLAADRRPGLVKGIVWTVVAAPDTPFADRLPWGLTAVPVSYDPPVAAVSDLAVARITPPPEAQRPPYRLQMEPARRLTNLARVPVLLVSGEFDGRRQTPAVAEYLRQAGCPAEHLRLQDRGIRGNGEFVMMEDNRRQVFDAIEEWIGRTVRVP